MFVITDSCLTISICFSEQCRHCVGLIQIENLRDFTAIHTTEKLGALEVGMEPIAPLCPWKEFRERDGAF